MTDIAPTSSASVHSAKDIVDGITTPYVRSNDDDDFLDDGSIKSQGPQPWIRTTLLHRLEHYVFFSKSGLELSACVIAGALVFASGYFFTVPNQRPIPFQYLENTGDYIRNLSNDQEEVDSTVPTWMLGVIALVLCPLFQILLSCTRFAASGDIHRTLCVYALTIPSNEMATWLLKLYVGWLRPNFYATCQPDDTYEYCTKSTGDDDDVDFEESMNPRLSFPSGHASWSFASLTLLYLFLERTFGLSSVVKAKILIPAAAQQETAPDFNAHIIMEYQRPPFLYRFFSILALAPLAVAAFIASSRIVDNKHFPADVIAGSLLGAFLANFFHNLWFPDPRFSVQCLPSK